MTPQENLTRRRDDYRRVIDMIFDHLTGDAEEIAPLLKDPVFQVPVEEASIEMQHSTIDDVLGRAPSAEQAAVVARRLLLEGLFLPTFHYIEALRKAVPVVERELGEAYLSEAKEVTFAIPFLARTILEYQSRRRQSRSSE